MAQPRKQSSRRSGRGAMPHVNRAAQNGFTRQVRGYDAPGEGMEHDPFAVADLALTNRIAEKLEAHYPAHPWMVSVSHAQGVAMIKIPILMKAHEQWVIHINTLKGDPGLKAVMRAGGAILEKYNVPRHAFRLDDFLHARDKAIAKPKPRLFVPESFGGARPKHAQVIA